MSVAAQEQSVSRTPEVHVASEAEKNLVQNVATHVSEMGGEVNEQQVRPVTAQTPITNTPEMQQVQANILGEEPTSLEKAGEAIASVFTDLPDAVFGKSKIRTMESNELPLDISVARAKKMNPGEQIALVERKRAA